MMTRALFFVSLLALSILCPPAPARRTDGATDDASLADDAKADRAGGGSSYYLVRPDLRRCASPTCGDSFVKRVNFASTTCATALRRRVHVAAVDYRQAKLDRRRRG